MILKVEALHHYIESIPTYTHEFPENCVCLQLKNAGLLIMMNASMENYFWNAIITMKSQEYEDVQ